MNRIDTCVGLRRRAWKLVIAMSALGALPLWAQDAARVVPSTSAQNSPSGSRLADGSLKTAALPVIGPSLTPSAKWQNNVSAQISAPLLNQFMERSVNDQRQVQENMMGAQSTGNAFTTGKINVELVPFTERVLMNIHFVGRTDVPDNVSQRGSVSVFSTCNTSVDARKPVYVDVNGVHPQPAQAQCASSVQVSDVNAKNRFVEKIGWRKTERMHGQMEQAASERAQVRSAQQLDEQANPLLANADMAFKEKFLTPLKTRGVFPARMQFSSTASHIHVSALEASPTQRGATSSPQLNMKHDLALGAHESFLENTCELTLAGKKVTDKQFLELMKLATGESPRHLWIHAHAPRWDVTLAKRKPLMIRLEEGRATATISFENASRADDQLNQPFKLSFVYRPELVAGSHQLIREGDLKFEFDDKHAAAAPSQELQAFFTKKLFAVFREEIHFDGLVPPAGGTWGKLRQVEAKELRTQAGWLVLGYQLK